MEVSIKVSGLTELIEALHKSEDTTRNNLRIAMKRSVQVVQKHAQRNHRFKSNTGKLEQSIQAETYDNPLLGIISLGGKEANVPYGIFVHEGTKPHLIAPKNKMALRWVGGSGFIFAKSVHHPGTRPDPFLYDAAEKKQGEVESIFQESINMAIQEAGL